jgi:hypothetical protein
MCTHMLLPDVDGILPLKICFILRLNYNVRQSQDRTGRRPFSDRDSADRFDSQFSGYTRHDREESSFIIMSSWEPAYLCQCDSNIVLPTDSRGKDILHVTVKADELVGMIGLYVEELLDREDLTRKSLGNCTSAYINHF